MSSKKREVTVNMMLEESDTEAVPAVNPYQIYCDMDGVLVDFESGAVDVVNRVMKHVRTNMHRYKSIVPDRRNPEYKLYALTKKLAERGRGWSSEYDWSDIANESPTKIKAASELMYFLAARDQSWWENLGWAPGGKELWNYIKKYNPIILTSGMGQQPNGENKSANGKRIWCKRELGIDADRVIVTSNKGVNTGNKVGILIDDRLKPLSQFHGIKIHYKTGNPHKAIEKLKDLGL